MFEHPKLASCPFYGFIQVSGRAASPMGWTCGDVIEDQTQDRTTPELANGMADKFSYIAVQSQFANAKSTRFSLRFPGANRVCGAARAVSWRN